MHSGSIHNPRTCEARILRALEEAGSWLSTLQVSERSGKPMNVATYRSSINAQLEAEQDARFVERRQVGRVHEYRLVRREPEQMEFNLAGVTAGA